MKNKIILFSFLSIIILNGCSSRRDIVSYWSGNDMVADGNISDWRGSLDTLSEYNVMMGIKNDKNSLTLCIATNDFMQALRIIKSNFIIWFEPEAQPENAIGIKFPLRDILDEQQNEYKYLSPMPGKEKPWNIIKKLINGQDELQILNYKSYSLGLFPLKNPDGITAALNVEDTIFVYELNIPIQENSSKYNISVHPGESLKITFETEELGFEKPGGGPPPGSGFPGQGNPSGNFPQGKRPDGKNRDIIFNEPAKPLNLSVNVKLSQEQN